MRITGGSARGIPLRAPCGKDTRPATDRTREAVFSSLSLQVSGARVADLFAGTGAYGLEALSRGAAEACFFDRDSAAMGCLRANATAVLRSAALPESSVRIERYDLERPLRTALRPFDLVFLDPPYALHGERLAGIVRRVVLPIIHPDSRVLLEIPGHASADFPGFTELRRIGRARPNKPTVALLRPD